MISTQIIYNAYVMVADEVADLRYLGKGVYLLQMVGENLPSKMNSYAVQQTLKHALLKKECLK